MIKKKDKLILIDGNTIDFSIFMNDNFLKDLVRNPSNYKKLLNLVKEDCRCKKYQYDNSAYSFVNDGVFNINFVRKLLTIIKEYEKEINYQNGSQDPYEILGMFADFPFEDTVLALFLNSYIIDYIKRNDPKWFTLLARTLKHRDYLLYVLKKADDKRHLKIVFSIIRKEMEKYQNDINYYNITSTDVEFFEINKIYSI